MTITLEVVMKIPMLFVTLLWAVGCATIQNSANSALETEPDQVIVEAKFTEAGAVLSAPRIITTSGEEARIEIGEFAAVPGQIEQVQSGILLTILAEIRDAKIVFRGSCQVKKALVEAIDRISRWPVFILARRFLKASPAPAKSSMLRLTVPMVRNLS